MAESLPSEAIEAHIEGDTSGQIAVGKNILQVGKVHGDVVYHAAPEQQPRARARPRPIRKRPRRFPGLLDREGEVNAAVAALESPEPVEFSGEDGLGKTTLLRHMARHPSADDFSDGIVYLQVGDKPESDVLQELFDVFYERDPSMKPTDTQIAMYLGEVEALILLDDVELPREKVQALMDNMPESTFVLASPGRCLWGEGCAVALEGLPVEDALALVERELGRALTPKERPNAESICKALDGHPLHILQAIAWAKEEGLSLEQVARKVEDPVTLKRQILERLSDLQRDILKQLASLAGAPLDARRLAEMLKVRVEKLTPELQSLQELRLLEAHSPRYSLAGTLGEDLQHLWDLDPWRERALDHFTAWAEEHHVAPERVLEEAEAILKVLRWGAGAGRWKEVLGLGRALESGLTLRMQWGAWGQVLQWLLEGARAVEDQTAEGFALHQLGTRALCLEDVGTARTSLKKALQLREALGDRIGAGVTRHNLEILLGPPAPPWAERLFQYGGPVIVIFILWLLSRQTQVEIWLKDGCDREYNPGDQTHLFVEADTKCYARIRLDGEKITGKDILLTPGKPWSTDWPFKDIPPGEHRLTADFRRDVPSLEASLEDRDEAECSFSVRWVVRTLALDDDQNLYVGGDFTSIGGVQANYIAMWDGSSWSALGDGPGGPVWSLAVDNRFGSVYAVTETVPTGDVANIAKWNEGSWSPLGSGVCEPGSGLKCWVRGLAADDNGNLYAGGWFFHGIPRHGNGLETWRSG